MWINLGETHWFSVLYLGPIGKRDTDVICKIGPKAEVLKRAGLSQILTEEYDLLAAHKYMRCVYAHVCCHITTEIEKLQPDYNHLNQDGRVIWNKWLRLDLWGW